MIDRVQLFIESTSGRFGLLTPRSFMRIHVPHPEIKSVITAPASLLCFPGSDMGTRRPCMRTDN